MGTNSLTKMLILFVCVLNLRVASVTATGEVSYYNYKVIRVNATNEHQVKFLYTLTDLEFYDFWSAPSLTRPVDIMVPPNEVSHFINLMSDQDLKPEVHISNVQKLVDDERAQTGERVRKSGFDWNDYYELDNMYDWLDSLAREYPDVVTPVIGGYSCQGREIRGVKVSRKPRKPVVFIEGGIHAREWIAHATVTYMLNELVTGKNRDIRKLTECFEFHIFPCVNPDGYVYTFQTDRMWRKTRSPGPKGCYGTDPNRNWDFHWNGTKPFSEIEIRTLSEYIRTLQDVMCVYLSFHSFSQLLMFPWGYTREHVDNYDELMDIGKKAADALEKVNGTKYKVGSFYETIYPGSGVSLDWVKGVLGTRYAYSYELRDTGDHGFILPPDQIKDTGLETVASLVVILQNVKCQKKVHCRH